MFTLEKSNAEKKVPSSTRKLTSHRVLTSDEIFSIKTTKMQEKQQLAQQKQMRKEAREMKKRQLAVKKNRA